MHLAETYGDRAWAVCSMDEPTGLRWPVHGRRLNPVYPYIEAEVRWAVRREYAATAVDIIARRTRLSFLNSEASLEALPKVIDLMAKELGWNKQRMEKEFQDGTEFLTSMGLSAKRMEGYTLDDVRAGRHLAILAIDDDLVARTIFTSDEMKILRSKFRQIDQDLDGMISADDLTSMMKRLGYADVPTSTIEAIIHEVDSNHDGKIELANFFDVLAGVKELALTNAFSDIVTKVVPSSDEDNPGYSNETSIKKLGGGV